MRGFAMAKGHNPSPCPSPHGRGDAVALSVRSFRSCTADATSPLPGGEGQGEGRFPQFDTPSSLMRMRLRLRRGASRVTLMAASRLAMTDAAPERSGLLAAGRIRRWFLTLALAVMPAAAANAQICTLGTTPVNFG